MGKFFAARVFLATGLTTALAADYYLDPSGMKLTKHGSLATESPTQARLLHPASHQYFDNHP